MQETSYQKNVNSLTGAMGPRNPAFWNLYNETTGKPWSLGAQPLYYNPAKGTYVTSYSQNSEPQSISFYSKGTFNPSASFGKKSKKKTKKSKKSKKSKKYKKTSKIKKLLNYLRFPF